jgi:hypothetical protein
LGSLPRAAHTAATTDLKLRGECASAEIMGCANMTLYRFLRRAHETPSTALENAANGLETPEPGTVASKPALSASRQDSSVPPVFCTCGNTYSGSAEGDTGQFIPLNSFALSGGSVPAAAAIAQAASRAERAMGQCCR